MTWFKEALERRTVSPFQLTESPVQASVEASLFAGTSKVAEKKFDSFKVHRKRIVDAHARWDIFQEETEWDRLTLLFRLKIEAGDIFTGTPCLFSVDAICKKTRWRTARSSEFIAV